MFVNFNLIIFCTIVISVVNCSFIISNDFAEATIKVFQNNLNENDTVIYYDENDRICAKQMINLLIELINGEIWALNAVDAWGKMPSGMLSGAFHEYGNYDQCLAIAHTSNKSTNNDFHGQYCLSNVLVSIPDGIELPIKYQSKTFAGHLSTPMPFETEHDAIFRQENNLQTLVLNIGMCVPKSCSPTFLTDNINKVIDFVENFTQTPDILKILITDASCQIITETEYTPMDIFAICFFSIIVALMVSSTAYDILMTLQKRHKNPNLNAFSMYTNGEKLFKCTQSKSPDVLSCINGIRALSIVWVVYGHAHSMHLGGIMNTIEIFTWIKNPYSMFLIAGPLSVDTFFMLSGLLVSFTMLKHIDSTKGKLNVPMLYLHRYLRLTPALAAAMLFNATLFRHTSNGPIWPTVDKQAVCEKTWWSTLLYIQNYVDPMSFCIGVTWYLMIDMQLFILSPLIIYPLWRWRNKFVWTIPILIILSMSCVFAVFVVNHFSVNLLYQGIDQYEKTYAPTHTRFGAWGVGVLVGYILHVSKSKPVHLSNSFVACGWIISIGGVFSIIFGLYPMSQVTNIPTDLQSSFYESFSRVCWAIALGWIIFACVHGYGEPINWFLSWPQWQPLSRLSYSVYLLHSIVQFYIFGSARTLKYFSEFNATHKFWGDFGITLCIAVFWTMAFESPILILEKMLFGKRRSKNPNKSQESLVTNGK